MSLAMSSCPIVDELHAAYCAAMSTPIRLNPAFERYWFDAYKQGLTPDMVRLVVAHRKQRIREGVRRPESLLLRNIAGSDEAIADVLNEAAALEAAKRAKPADANRDQVLRQSGRVGHVQPGARPAADVVARNMAALRAAVGPP